MDTVEHLRRDPRAFEMVLMDVQMPLTKPFEPAALIEIVQRYLADPPVEIESRVGG